MKKLIGLMIALTLVISLFACGQSEAEQKPESGAAAETGTAEVTEAAAESTDTNSEGNTQAETSDEVTQADIEENIIGTWIVADRNGQPAFTNEKGVFTFVSPTQAYVSASFNARPTQGFPWIDSLEADVDITGNKVTVTRLSDEDTIIVNELSISNITDTENKGSLIVKSVEDGEETIITEEPVRLVKVNEDYSNDIIGTWEGHCTSEGSVFDDGQEHRWEYKGDGTYVYYVKDGDDWVPSDNELNEYFVAGNLLCTRWVDDGTEYREWWEIAIDGGKMNWTALREDEDGKTYTAAFEMKRVNEEKEGLVEQAKALIDAEEYEAAIPLLEEAAELGNAEAQYNLGRCYDHGYGVEQDYKKAVEYYRLAADQGDSYAQYNLGCCYYTGDGVEQDYEKAVEYYLLAADQGDDLAQYALGICYYNGNGVEQDYEKAVEYYRLAADQGDAYAQCNLGYCYYDGEGVDQDYDEAVKYYKLAADQGDPNAMFAIGDCYYTGNGVKKDLEEAAKWYQKAMDAGYEAMNEEEKEHLVAVLGEGYDS